MPKALERLPTEPRDCIWRDCIKLDEDDVDVDIGFNDSTVFPSGMMGHQFPSGMMGLNIQGYILQRLCHEMFATLGKRTWLQSRGGYAGAKISLEDELTAARQVARRIQQTRTPTGVTTRPTYLELSTLVSLD